jgi:hypothetical protein
MSPPSSRQPASRLGTSVRAACAAAGLAGLLVALPWGLAVTIGSPVPGLSDLVAGDVSDAAVIAVLASVTWLAWAQFALAVVVETVSIVAHAPIRQGIPGVLPGQQHLARALVTAVFVLIPALSPIANAATAHAATATASVTATLRSGSPETTKGSVHASSSIPAAAPTSQGERAYGQASSEVAQDAMRPRVRTYAVTADGPGTYWDLAQVYLGGVRAVRAYQRPDLAVTVQPLPQPGLVRVSQVVQVHVQTAPAGNLHRDLLVPMLLAIAHTATISVRTDTLRWSPAPTGRGLR